MLSAHIKMIAGSDKMMARWQTYAEKFLYITPREQYLIILTGLVAITFVIFSLFIDDNLVHIDKLEKQQRENVGNIASTQTTVNILTDALAKNPNKAVQLQLEQYQQQMNEVDEKLSLLASDLINPIQMRHALISLLSSQKNVSLASFEILGAQEMKLPEPGENSTEKKQTTQSISLFKHGVKLTLTGNFFALKDYLEALEKMKWKFFWQSFDYQLMAYPTGELTITMYSLSTNKEFLGV